MTQFQENAWTGWMEGPKDRRTEEWTDPIS